MRIIFEKVTKNNKHIAYKIKPFKEQKKHIESVFRSMLEAKVFKCWRCVLIKDNNDYIGFAMYGFWKNEGSNGRLWLDRFLIDARFQGTGYSKPILIKLLDKLKNEYKCEQLFLSVYKDNPRAIKIYEDLGFRFNGEKDINGELIMILKF